jgi:predicted NBD/HSP70 family sugar kinase/biotin operon repressor
LTATNKRQKTVIDPSGGANQTRLRAYNERLILSFIRRHSRISKSQLAKRTGLSAQAVTMIIRALEKDGLLLRGEPQRGQVGQPSIPMSLNPQGVYSIGLKIGRRRADLVLMNFVGEPQKMLHRVYPFPQPDEVLEFVRRGIDELVGELGEELRPRIAGLGVAMPFQLWDWTDNVGAPPGMMEGWRNFDIKTEIETICDYPVTVENDATSACGAELVFGRGSEFSDFVYFFIGAFIGGGVVLNHAVYRGRSGNAGAVGSMPVLGPVLGKNGATSQLIEHASIYVLENRLRDKGIDPSPLWLQLDDWQEFDDLVAEWIVEVGKSLALAIVASCSVIDFDAAIIDGSFPPNVRQKIVDETRRELAKLDLQGIEKPSIVAGKTGHDAQVLGSASLPLFARYLLDQNVLFTEPQQGGNGA